MTGYPQPGSTLGNEPVGVASQRYFGLWYDREPFLQRARRSSRLTIPSIYREIGENSTTTETLPWQSLGSQGVENMNAKLVNTMFPAAIPWAKLDPSTAALREAAQLPQEQQAPWREAVMSGLSKVQQEFLKCVAQDGDRKKLIDAGKHLIIGGNHCLKIDRKQAKLQSIRLERYITIRDNIGDLQEFIVQDGMAFQTLPDDIQQMAVGNGFDPKSNRDGVKSIDVYTHGQLRNGAWDMYQECYGERVPGSEERLDEDVMPFIFLRMIALEKENYGRSYCEHYEADLQTLDGYYQFLTEAGANIAQLKWLVKPGGVTNKKAFAEAANGDVLTGDIDDVQAVRSDKGGDLQFSTAILDRVEKRLERAFVMGQSVTRNAERVTAEEIQVMTQELDETLGGVYSNLSTDWQYPYAVKKLGVLQRTGRISKLPKGLTTLSIRSGEDALADTKEAQDLDRVLGTAGQILTPQVLATYILPHDYLARQFAKNGIDMDGLIKGDAQVQQEQQQQQQDQLTHEVAPQVAAQAGQMMQNHQQNLAAQAQQQQAPAPQAQPQGQ